MIDQHFVISDEYIELNKLLKASGLCDTGGQTKMVIEDKLVTVNGETETRKRRKSHSHIHGSTLNQEREGIKNVKITYFQLRRHQQ